MENQENIKNPDTTEDLCRTCLTSSVKMFPIFNISEEPYDLLSKIKVSTSIKIHKSDGLPQNICEICIEAINVAYDFRQRSDQADTMLRQRLLEFPKSGNFQDAHFVQNELHVETEQNISTRKRKRTRKIFHDYLENETSEKDEKDTLVDISNSKENRTCNICGKVSVSYRGHCIHMAKHNGSRGNYCAICDKMFLSGITAHMRIHTGEKPFKCEECEKSFAKSSTLKDHQRSHLGIKPHKCDTCGRGFGTKRQMIVHTRIHTGVKPHLCNVCGKKFTQLSSLSGHLRTHTGEKPYKCNVCFKMYPTSSALTQHRAQHTLNEDDGLNTESRAKALCNICGKHYRSSTTLQQHMTKHTGLTKYNCGMCGRGFAREDHLRAHTRIHTGERPYACTICKKTFTQSNVLRTHMALHTGKTFVCNICGSTFARPALLNRHMKVHLENFQLREDSTLHRGAERHKSSLVITSNANEIRSFEQSEKSTKQSTIIHTFRDISDELKINYDEEEPDGTEKESQISNGNIIVIKPLSNPNCTAVINMRNQSNLQPNNELCTIEIITKNEDEYVSDLIEAQEP